MRRVLRRARSERGQAALLLALALAGTLVAAGVGLDAGLLYVERRHEQVAVDAAAYAAAVELAKNWDKPNRAALARDAALAYAASNGYPAAAVTVNIPPLSGAYAGNADYAEVLANATVRTAFVRLLGPGFETRDVSARAVGGITGPAKPYAIIVLSKDASKSLEVNGNVELRADEAGILVNSNAADALWGVGNAQIRSEPFGINVVGGSSLTPSVDVRGPLTSGAAQIADPLAYLVPPTGLGLPTFGAIDVTGGEVLLDPGTYQSIKVSGTGRVRLRPGTYVIRGGGISVTGAGRLEDEVIGDAQGVFIYNACANFPAAGGICGQIKTDGNGRIDLDRGSVGESAGMSIWQPCENTQTLSITGKSSGQSSHKIETSGTVYAPCAEAHVFGGGQFEGMLRVRDGQLVVKTLKLTGQARVEVDWDSAAGTTSRIPAVVE